MMRTRVASIAGMGLALLAAWGLEHRLRSSDAPTVDDAVASVDSARSANPSVESGPQRIVLARADQDTTPVDEGRRWSPDRSDQALGSIQGAEPTPEAVAPSVDGSSSQPEELDAAPVLGPPESESDAAPPPPPSLAPGVTGRTVPAITAAHSIEAMPLPLALIPTERTLRAESEEAPAVDPTAGTDAAGSTPDAESPASLGSGTVPGADPQP